MKSTNKYYAGIGARKTPKDILELMTEVARKMDENGFILRSGGAEGADKAFEKGAQNKAIYYPSDVTPVSMCIASGFHPSWSGMGMYSKKLHARNVFQILGKRMIIPSEFVLCWTTDNAITHDERSRKTGGTGTAISIASFFNIPVYNLKRDDHLRRVIEWLN